MESMLSFVGIIIIVFGVLQIILFFKMWVMTNDVKSIKEKVSYSNNAIIELAAGNLDKAIELARIEFVTEIYKMYSEICSTINTTSTDYNQRSDSYLDKYSKIESKYRNKFDNATSFLNFDKFSTLEKAKNIFH